MIFRKSGSVKVDYYISLPFSEIPLSTRMSSPPLRKSADERWKKGEYNHQLAIKLSRALNTVNPNDILAQRVSDLAKQHDLEGFSKGIVAVVGCSVV